MNKFPISIQHTTSLNWQVYDKQRWHIEIYTMKQSLILPGSFSIFRFVSSATGWNTSWEAIKFDNIVSPSIYNGLFYLKNTVLYQKLAWYLKHFLLY